MSPAGSRSQARSAGRFDQGAGAPARGAASARAAALVSHEEWAALGRAARRDAPRSSHGAWAPAADRPDPVALLEEQAESRVPELVPIRHGRMLASPSTFYRGAALIMAADLAATPVSGFNVQLCGDAHLLNFGVFASPERQMLFDLNDFDETLPGPWEWDVKRLAASFEVAGRDLGFSPADRRDIVIAGVARVPRGHAPGGADGRPRRLVCAPDERRRHGLDRAEVRAGRLGKREAREAGAGLGQGRDARPRAGVQTAGRARSTAGCASWPIPRWWCRSTIWSCRARPVKRRRSGCARWCTPTGARCRRRITPSRSSATSTRRARSWASAASARAPGSSSSSAASDQAPLFLQAKEAQPSVLERYLGRSALRKPRPARRRGPAPDAGGQRHVSRLAALRGPRRADARLLRAPAPRLEGRRATSRPCACRARRSTRDCAARPWRGRTRAWATGSRSPRTSARATRSTGPWPTSRSPTPTRTSATTRPSPSPSARDA